jgi:hypothetical protein
VLDHGFDANGSIAEQQQDTDTGGAVSGAGLADVFQMANDMANLSRPRSTPSEAHRANSE